MFSTFQLGWSGLIHRGGREGVGGVSGLVMAGLSSCSGRLLRKLEHQDEVELSSLVSLGLRRVFRAASRCEPSLGIPDRNIEREQGLGADCRSKIQRAVFLQLKLARGADCFDGSAVQHRCHFFDTSCCERHRLFRKHGWILVRARIESTRRILSFGAESKNLFEG